MKTVITNITIETSGPEEGLTEEVIERYRRNIYRSIKDDVDEGSKITVDIEIK